MSSVINTNVSSLNAQRNLSSSQTSLATSLQRLSSGMRINSAKDDAAGLAISTRMSSQINGLNQASRNANDAISMTQTAEGGLSTTTDMLQRMRDLAVQSANGSNSSSDRAALQKEVSQLAQEINRTASTTQFNGQNILDGSMGNVQFQVGANANQTIGFSIASAKATDLGNYKVGANSGAGTISAAAGFDTTASTPLTVQNNVKAQNLTISGNGKTSTAIPITDGEQANKIAASINAQSATTGVSATAKTDATLSGITAGSVSFKLTGSNGATIDVSGTVSDTNDLSSLAASINSQSASTNVTAIADSNGKLKLTNSDGSDVKIQATAGMNGATIKGDASSSAVTFNSTATGTKVDTTVVGGTLSFKSSSGFTVSTDGGTAGTDKSLFATKLNSGSLSKVSDIDVSSASGANDALDIIDAALQSVNDSRAALGALQNRFSSTISNLQTSSENMSASRSRIQDADFAAESANMTRNQVLQQAGTAMLAQANQLPNSVMSLLRG
jgi:flagellin